jgi:prepilin-type N-terminal cleavage/methylation domain-containing protein
MRRQPSPRPSPATEGLREGINRSTWLRDSGDSAFRRQDGDGVMFGRTRLQVVSRQRRRFRITDFGLRTENPQSEIRNPKSSSLPRHSSLDIRHSSFHRAVQTPKDQGRQPGRLAFTLVELLVVIAIIGILVALLLPAIQAAREAARRSQCQNNLKNLGLALHNYHDNYKAFPPALLTLTNAGDGVMNGSRLFSTWSILILPYMEEQSLHDKFDIVPFTRRITDDAAGSTRNQDARGTELPVFRCPSDRGPASRYHGTFAGKDSPNWARGNYGLNAFQFWPASFNSIDPILGSTWDNWNAGIGGINKSNSIAKITDGTSNTIMLGEMRVGVVEDDPRGVWALGMCGSNYHCRHVTNYTWSPNSCYGGDDDLYNGPNIITEYGDQNLAAECMLPWSGGGLSGQSVMRSSHVGGIFVAMADASVRFISDFIDTGQQTAATADGRLGGPFNTSPDNFRTWQRLNVASDGLPIQGDF